MTKRTESQWLALIEQHKLSGLSAAAFCRERGLDAKYFCLRKKQLCPSPATFIKVTPDPSMDINSSSSGIKLRVIEVELPLSGSGQSDTLPLILDRLLG